eukprot:48802_1
MQMMIASARYLRFIPLTFNIYKSMRVEAYAAASQTGMPLIDSLPNEAFSSSSYHSVMCVPYNARRSSPQAWCPLTNNAGEYLQIDLGTDYRIVSVSVYPRNDIYTQYNQYVTTYTLKYSSDGSTFTEYPQTLTGPQQSNTGVDANDDCKCEIFKIYPINIQYLQINAC